MLCSAPQPVVQSRRRPLLGPSPGWKRLLALSHLRHYAKLALTPRSLNVKLGPRRNYHKGSASRHFQPGEGPRPSPWLWKPIVKPMDRFAALVLSATLRGNTGQQEVNSIVMMLFYCQPIISTFETFLIRPCNHASVEIICSRSMYYYYLFEWANEIVIQKRYKHLLEINNLSSMHNTHKMNCIISITFKTWMILNNIQYSNA